MKFSLISLFIAVVLQVLIIAPLNYASSNDGNLIAMNVEEDALSGNPSIYYQQQVNIDSFLFERYVHNMYWRLGLNSHGLSKDAFRYGIIGMYNLLDDGALNDRSVLSIVDYSASSSLKRFYLIDLKNQELLYHTLVSHGMNSGEECATTFSNTYQSYASSIGFYVTKLTYFGKHGYSLRLEGWDEGFNNNMLERAVVIHGAYYLSNEFIEKNGRIGRSRGCPALPPQLSTPIINLIKNRSTVFGYYPDADFFAKSTNLNLRTAVMQFSNSSSEI